MSNLMNTRTVHKILKDNNLPFSASNKNVKCDSFFLGKLARIPLALVDHTSTCPFDIVHSDVWGPVPIQSNLGF